MCDQTNSSQYRARALFFPLTLTHAKPSDHVWLVGCFSWLHFRGPNLCNWESHCFMRVFFLKDGDKSSPAQPRTHSCGDINYSWLDHISANVPSCGRYDGVLIFQVNVGDIEEYLQRRWKDVCTAIRQSVLSTQVRATLSKHFRLSVSRTILLLHIWNQLFLFLFYQNVEI